jgi:hypothetical protein
MATHFKTTPHSKQETNSHKSTLACTSHWSINHIVKKAQKNLS